MIAYIVSSFTAAGLLALLSAHLRRRILRKRFLQIASKIIPSTNTLSLEIGEDGILLARSRGYVKATRFIIIDEPATSPRRLDDQELGRLSRKFASIVYSTSSETQVIVLRTPMDLRRTLKSLEKKILNMRLTLEYNPEDKGLERKLRVLEAVHSRIISGEKPSRSKIMLGVSLRDKDAETCLRRVKAESDAILSTLGSLGLKARIASREEVSNTLLAIMGVGEPERLATHLETDISYIGPGLLDRQPTGRGVYLGRDLETNAPFFYDLEKYGTRHIVVVGPTGRGKTTLLRVLAARSAAIYKDLKLLLIDFKGDLTPQLSGLVCVRDPSTISFTELTRLPANYPEGAWAYLILESVKTAIELEVGEEHALYSSMLSALHEEGVIRPERLVENSKGHPALLSKLEYIVGSSSMHEAGEQASLYAGYNLGSLPGDKKNIYASLILARLIADIEASGLSEQLSRLIIVDEAWRLTRGGGAVVKRLVKEARSYGVSVVLATQNIEDLPPEILDNAGTFIAFGSPAEEYLGKVARYSSLTRVEVEKLKWFTTGDALLRIYDDPRPFWIHVDPAITL